MGKLPERMEGATVPTLSITWQDEDGNARTIAGSLTGFKTDLDTGTTTAIGGTLTGLSTTGVFTFAPNSTDVAASGRFSVYFIDTSGANIAKSNPVTWNIIDAPTT